MNNKGKADNTAKLMTAEDTIAQICERLSFFFSNANLRSDRFMQKQIGRGDDFGGSITVETLLTFKSIQQYTTDAQQVLDAAKSLSDFLVVEGDKISRKEPMKKSQMDDNIPVSLHVTNVPVEDQKYAVTTADMRALFEVYGSVILVKLKWMPQPTDPESDYNDRHERNTRRKMVPSGECLIEFSLEEDLEKAVSDLVGESPKVTLEIKGNKLKVEKLRDWIDRIKSKNPRKSKDDKHQEGEGVKRQREEIVEFEPFTIDWKPGCVVELKGLNSETCDREALRETVKDVANVFADYSRGQTEGAIRFPEPGEHIDELANKLNNGDILVGGKKVDSARVLEGDEEKAYWQKFIDFKNNQRRQKAEEKANKSKNKSYSNKRRRN